MPYKMMNSKYTLKLGLVAEDKNYDIFCFDYNFYEPMLMKQFEEKFIEHYYDNEIGFDTFTQFQRRLRARLNLKYPYWRQLYETELRSKGIDFMLNKDLKETFIRELEGSNERNSNHSSVANGEYNSNGSSSNDYKESSVDNGNASLDDDDLTTINKGNNINSENTNSSSTSQGDNNSTGTNKETETTTLLSQGNIGTTSSAELLEKWRSVIINLDELIIKDCRPLFLSIL